MYLFRFSVTYRILCIDEIDRLLTRERSIVYDLFEWPYLSSNVIIVIGIANSIDLVEKALPLLKIGQCEDSLLPLRIAKKPETFVFPSYTATDLKSILEQRISLCNESLHSSFPLFQPGAIALCSKKVVCVAPHLSSTGRNGRRASSSRRLQSRAPSLLPRGSRHRLLVRHPPVHVDRPPPVLPLESGVPRRRASSSGAGVAGVSVRDGGGGGGAGEEEEGSHAGAAEGGVRAGAQDGGGWNATESRGVQPTHGPAYAQRDLQDCGCEADEACGPTGWRWTEG